MTARLVSLIASLVTSGQGSSSAAMPAKPGLSDDRLCLETPSKIKKISQQS